MTIISAKTEDLELNLDIKVDMGWSEEDIRDLKNELLKILVNLQNQVDRWKEIRDKHAEGL